MYKIVIIVVLVFNLYARRLIAVLFWLISRNVSVPSTLIFLLLVFEFPGFIIKTLLLSINLCKCDKSSSLWKWYLNTVWHNFTYLLISLKVVKNLKNEHFKHFPVNIISRHKTPPLLNNNYLMCRYKLLTNQLHQPNP